MNRAKLAGGVIVGIGVLMSMSMMSAQAVSLTIDDPSFESAILAPGAHTNGVPDTDWEISASAGFFHPNGQLNPLTIDGDDIAFSAGGTLCQVLDDPITGDTQYTLSVWVGNRSGGLPFPGYDIELFNDDDNILLAFIDETTGNPPGNGEWLENILTHTVSAGDVDNIGDHLKICLSSVGQQTNFDAIHLDTTPEGCSPGFWKTDASKRSQVTWDATANDLDPSDDWDDFFTDVTLRVKGVGMTNIVDLEDALNAKGGKINALAREAAAALLNADHLDIAYPLTQAEIIILVNAAIAGDNTDIENARATLFALNHNSEDSICPLPQG